VTEHHNLTILNTGKTDTELAAEFRNKLRPLLDEALGVLNDASKSGLQVNFQFGRDVYGRHMVVSIDVVRPLWHPPLWC
jgi:hypothetical protein